MKTKLTKQDIDKINARYRAKCEEFDKLSKEELDKLAEGFKGSSTDRTALADVLQHKMRLAMLEQFKNTEKIEEVDSEKLEIDTKATYEQHKRDHDNNESLSPPIYKKVVSKEEDTIDDTLHR